MRAKFTIYSVGSALNIALSYALLIVFSTHLSKPDYATYGYYTAVIALVVMVINFGHKETLLKACSLQNIFVLKRVSFTYFLVQCTLLLVCCILLLIEPQIGVVFLTAVVTNWLLTINHVNRGLGDYFKDGIATALHRLLWLIACLFYIYAEVDIGYLDLFILSLLSSLVAISILFPKNGKHFLKLPFFIHLLKRRCVILTRDTNTLFKFFLIEFATVAYLKVDIVFLRHFNIDQAKAADYFLSTQILDASVMLLTPIGYFFFNQYAKELRDEKIVASNRGNVSILRYIALLVSLVALGQLLWMFIGQWLLVTMFEKYLNSYEIILALLTTLYPLVINLIVSSYMILQHKEKQYMKICFIGLAVNVMFNLLLIPLLEVYGAVYSRLLTETSMTLLLVLYLKSHKTTNRDNNVLV